MSDKKMEVIYYELVKMEQRLTDKAEIVLRARDEINESLARFEILMKELSTKIDKKVLSNE